MELFQAIVLLLLGTAVFLTGMKMMSSGLQKCSGKGIKKLFSKTSESRFAGLGIGTLMTALVQSSDATSVMVIGFINAGVMTIFQGISIIMGAYIGTTATGLIVSLSSLGIVQYILMLLAFVGVVLNFFKKTLIKNIGEILTGLGLLFFGLYTLKLGLNMPVIHDSVVEMFDAINNPILLFLIGLIFTVFTQSSSATTGILIVMVGDGLLPATSAIFAAIGATIGTISSILLVTIGSNANAKRTANIALAMRSITGIIALAIIYVFRSNVDALAASLNNPALFMALFMLIYSTITMFLLLPFINPFINLFTKIIKDKDEEHKKKQIKYIDKHMLNQPAIALMQVYKEIENMYDLAYQNIQDCYNCLVNQTYEKSKEIEEKEDTIDYINNTITDYLIELTAKADSKQEREIGTLFHVLNDIERIGDHAFNFYGYSKDMFGDDLKFSPEAIKNISEIYDVILKMFDLAKEVFLTRDESKLSDLHELENITDELERKCNDYHYDRLQNNSCKVQLSSFFTSVVNALERIGDHLTNIGYSIKSPTGDDE